MPASLTLEENITTEILRERFLVEGCVDFSSCNPEDQSQTYISLEVKICLCQRRDLEKNVKRLSAANGISRLDAKGHAASGRAEGEETKTK